MPTDPTEEFLYRDYAKGYAEFDNGLLVNPASFEGISYQEVEDSELEMLADLPDVYSLAPLLPDPASQGLRGTCATFAATLCAELETGIGLSEQYVYCKAWQQQFPTRDSGDEGTYIMANIEVLRAGALAEENWRYSPFPNPARVHQGPPPANSPLHEFSVSVRSLKLGGSIQRRIAAAIYGSGLPVVAGLEVMSNCGWTNGREIDVGPNRTLRGRHAVCLTGYDLNAGFFVMRNSWGPLWGHRGNTVISAAYLRSYMDEALIFRKTAS